ncbi:hypothetical protein AB0K68_23470 [Streptomyces sp. NPDC050698]
MGCLRVTVCTSVLAVVALAPAAYAADGGSVSVTPVAPAPGSDVTLRVTGCAQRTAVAASPALVADARLTVTGAHELTGESRVRSTLPAGKYAVRVTCGDTRRTGTLTVRDGGQPRSQAVSEAPEAGSEAPEDGLEAPEGGPGGAEDGPEGAEDAPDGSHDGPEAPDAASDAPRTALDTPEAVTGAAGQPPAPGKGGQPSAPGVDEEDTPSRRPGAPASPVAPVQAGGGGAADSLAAEDRGTGPGTAQGVTGLMLAGVAAVVVALRAVRRRRGTE